MPRPCECQPCTFTKRLLEAQEEKNRVSIESLLEERAQALLDGRIKGWQLVLSVNTLYELMLKEQKEEMAKRMVKGAEALVENLPGEVN